MRPSATVERMPTTPQDVLNALRQVRYPGFSRDIVSFGIVRDIEIGGTGTTITLAFPADAPDLAGQIAPEIERIATALPGVAPVRIVANRPSAPQPARARGPQPIAQVKHVLAVASGKGGVGKSTVAVNLAIALRQVAGGSRPVGLLDADVYGPSTPILLGIEGVKPEVSESKRIQPIAAHGLETISMGFFVEKERPIIWRGPMVAKLISEFLHNVDWGDLDYLVLDLPPGTGDVQLTLVQQVAISGGIIVTTPQEVALADVKRGLRMFQQVNVPVLGAIENMSGFVCGNCHHEFDIFGRGGGERMAHALGIPFLGAIPLLGRVRSLGDVGTPIVEAERTHPVAQQFRSIAERVASAVEAEVPSHDGVTTG